MESVSQMRGKFREKWTESLRDVSGSLREIRGRYAENVRYVRERMHGELARYTVTYRI